MRVHALRLHRAPSNVPSPHSPTSHSPHTAAAVSSAPLPISPLNVTEITQIHMEGDFLSEVLVAVQELLVADDVVQLSLPGDVADRCALEGRSTRRHGNLN